MLNTFVGFGAGRQFLLAQNVGVSLVLGKFSQHLEMQRPHWSFSTTGHRCVGGQLRKSLSRQFASRSMSSLHGRNRVGLVQCERSSRGRGDANIGVWTASDGLFEPHPFNEGDVFDQPEQRGVRRQQSRPGFVFAQPVERVVQRRSTVVNQLIKSPTKFDGPVRLVFEGRHDPKLTRSPHRRGRQSCHLNCA
jgi:hypothetical protein